MARSERASAAHELVHDRPGALDERLIHAPGLVQSLPQATRLAGACHGLHVGTPWVTARQVGDQQADGVRTDINCTDTHTFNLSDSGWEARRNRTSHSKTSSWASSKEILEVLTT
jgi:hypothetical protein